MTFGGPPPFKDFGYEEIKVIGRGQYGLVHLVRQIADQNCCVLKTIDLTCLSEKERETAKQEVELLRRLDHPNIVEYKDHFLMGNAIVIAMQYCENGDIATYIKEMARRRTRIKEAQVMNWFVQVLGVLEYVHGERILHRDLKTSNLFLTEKTTVVKLGDFGISRQFASTMELANSVVGTPHYMSPEVCENKPYTFKSDVWSLGCVLYELCMLKHAFAADNLLGLVHKIVSGKYESIPPMYSANLNNLIQRMLTRNATSRPSIRMLLEDKHLQGYLGTLSKSRGAGSPSPPATRGSNRTSGRAEASSPSTVNRRPGAKGAARGGATTNVRSLKQKPTAWPMHADRLNALPGEKATTAADEEYYEDDFCSEDDTDSDWDEGDMEFGVLSPVYEEVRDLETMSTAAATTASAAATVRAVAAAAAGGRASLQPVRSDASMRRIYGAARLDGAYPASPGSSSSAPFHSGGRAAASGSTANAVRQQPVRQTGQTRGFGAPTAASRNAAAAKSPPSTGVASLFSGAAPRHSSGAGSSGTNWGRGYQQSGTWNNK